jgi:hypothetical protein
MSASERDFSNYQLGDNPYELAAGLLPDMARALDYDLGVVPSEDALSNFIGHIGPAKELQQNIGLVQERLASDDDALTLAANWTERSGIVSPIHRSFKSTEVAVPSEFDTAVITGGVARWMLRRAAQLRDLSDVSELRFGEVLVGAGIREMKESEHSTVARLAELNGRLPTEADFAEEVIVPHLQAAGLRARAVRFDTRVGDEVVKDLANTIQNRATVLVAANAPAALQTAGQLRVAMRDIRPDFDTQGEQLFVSSDAIPVARHGESAATHQNPYTALGQIARNALFLYRSGEQ